MGILVSPSLLSFSTSLLRALYSLFPFFFRFRFRCHNAAATDRHLLLEATASTAGTQQAGGLAAIAMEKRTRQLELLHAASDSLVLISLSVLQHTQERVDRLKARVSEVERTKAEDIKALKDSYEEESRRREKEWNDERIRLEKVCYRCNDCHGQPCQGMLILGFPGALL